jgi:hypothetical protein
MGSNAFQQMRNCQIIIALGAWDIQVQALKIFTVKKSVHAHHQTQTHKVRAVRHASWLLVQIYRIVAQWKCITLATVFTKIESNVYSYMIW